MRTAFWETVVAEGCRVPEGAALDVGSAPEMMPPVPLGRRLALLVPGLRDQLVADEADHVAATGITAGR